jgi:hypothetical protein
MLTIKWYLIIPIHKKALNVYLVIGLFFGLSVQKEVDYGVAYDSDFLIDIINCFNSHKCLKSGVKMRGSELFSVVKDGRIGLTSEVWQCGLIFKDLLHIMVDILDCDFADCDVIWQKTSSVYIKIHAETFAERTVMVLFFEILYEGPPVSHKVLPTVLRTLILL